LACAAILIVITIKMISLSFIGRLFTDYFPVETGIVRGKFNGFQVYFHSKPKKVLVLLAPQSMIARVFM
jgi:hypothetical protein